MYGTTLVKLFLTGNVTLDHSNEYAYSGHLRPYLDDRLRHCMGLQSAQSRGWVLRAVKCRDDNLLQNGYICEYSKCLQYFRAIFIA